MTFPRIIYHTEGAFVAAACIVTYFLMHGSGMWFALLIFAPDLSMLGYVVNAKVGSLTYNTVHTYIWPIILGFVGVTMGYATLPIALIWAAHIGADHVLGYGLKYPTGFKDVDVARL